MTPDGLPMSPHDFAAAIDRLDAATQRFAAAADRVRDWDAPVPTCPGWTVRTLVTHLGLIHVWAGSTIGAEHAPDDPPFENDGAPLPDWYRARAAGLIEVLRAAGPDAPAWTLWGDRVAAFWARRQFHETAVHTFDLTESLAAGAGDPEPWSMPDELALDGLREVIAGFYQRQVRFGRTRGLPGVVRFEARTDDGALLASLDAPAFGGAAAGADPGAGESGGALLASLDAPAFEGAAAGADPGAGESGGALLASLDAPAFEGAAARPETGAGGAGGALLGTVAGTPTELYLAIWGRGAFPGASADLVEMLRAAKLTP